MANHARGHYDPSWSVKFDCSKSTLKRDVKFSKAAEIIAGNVGMTSMELAGGLSVQIPKKWVVLIATLDADTQRDLVGRIKKTRDRNAALVVLRNWAIEVGGEANGP